MNVKEALDIFQIDIKTTDTNALKARYREMAKINHPDLGGSHETMRMINNAFEILLTEIDFESRLTKHQAERISREEREKFYLKILERKISAFESEYLDELNNCPELPSDFSLDSSNVSNEWRHERKLWFTSKSEDIEVFLKFEVASRKESLTDGEDSEICVSFQGKVFAHGILQKLGSPRYSEKSRLGTTDLSSKTVLPIKKVVKTVEKNKSKKVGPKDFIYALSRKFTIREYSGDKINFYVENEEKRYVFCLFRQKFRGQGAYNLIGIMVKEGEYFWKSDRFLVEALIRVPYENRIFNEDREGLSTLLNSIERIKKSIIPSYEIHIKSKQGKENV